MKKQYFSRIQNPMTIIALFVGLIEIGFGLILIFSKLPENLQVILILFLVLFPVFCAVGFFAVLILRPYSFYGPGDFRSDKSYLSANKRIIEVRATAKAIDEEQKNLRPLNVDSVSALIGRLDKSTCAYLLKAANRPMSFNAHTDILARELASFLEDDNAPNDPSFTLMTLGHHRCLWTNFDRIIFSVIPSENEMFTIEIPAEVLALLGQRLGRAV